MKKTKRCPKCGSGRILKLNGDDWQPWRRGIFTGRTIFSALPVDVYVCGDCGYMEEWVPKAWLPKLLKRAERRRR